MTKYILGRLGQLVLVLIGVSVIVFFTMHVLPGDVATLLLGERATQAQLTSLRHQLALVPGADVLCMLDPEPGVGRLRDDYFSAIRT